MLRRARRRFGIAAPRLSVRAHIPWYLRWSLVLPFVLGALALAWWAYVSGLEFAGFHRSQTQQELTALHATVTRLTAENTQLNELLAQHERLIQIEQSSAAENSKQLKNLNDEIAKLQEDLAFFHNLTATHTQEGEVAIHRLRLEKDVMPGEFRVRMLLVQTGQRVPEFSGYYQLLATVLQNGQKSTQLFPVETAGNAQFALKFKYYQRVEQSIKLAPEVRLQSVQVRLFQQGGHEPKVKQEIAFTS